MGLQNKYETSYEVDSGYHRVDFEEWIIQDELLDLTCRRQGAGQMTTSGTPECNRRQTVGPVLVCAHICRSVYRKLLGHSKGDRKRRMIKCNVIWSRESK
jgi:hypothetical protein